MGNYHLRIFGPPKKPDILSSEERGLVEAIKEKKRAREKHRADLSATFKLLNESKLKVTKMILSEDEYNDIIRYP